MDRLSSAMIGAGALLLGWASTIVCVGCQPPPHDLGAAALLASRGQTDQAIERLEAALRRSSSNVVALKQLVRLYAAAGDWAGVQSAVQRLEARVGSRSPEPWLQLGYAFELQHDFHQALDAYDRAAEVAPLEAVGPSVGGRRAATWGQWALAEPRLREAIRRSASDPDLHHALGYVLLRLGKLAQARASYARGLQADSGAWANRLGLATVALAAHQPEQAAEEYRKLIKLRPDYIPAYLGYSWALGLAGHTVEARNASLQALKMGGAAEVVARQLEYLEARRGLATVPSTQRAPANRSESR